MPGPATPTTLLRYGLQTHPTKWCPSCIGAHSYGQRTPATGVELRFTMLLMRYLGPLPCAAYHPVVQAWHLHPRGNASVPCRETKLKPPRWRGWKECSAPGLCSSIVDRNSTCMKYLSTTTNSSLAGCNRRSNCTLCCSRGSLATWPALPAYTSWAVIVYYSPPVLGSGHR